MPTPIAPSDSVRVHRMFKKHSCTLTAHAATSAAASAVASWQPDAVLAWQSCDMFSRCASSPTSMSVLTLEQSTYSLLKQSPDALYALRSSGVLLV